MAELYSQYASGQQFPAGLIAGSFNGVSGLNPIIDRINYITQNDGIISGTSIIIYSDNVKLGLAGGEGIDIAGGSVISAELATTTNKGVASFSSSDFDVSAGAVTLEDTVVKSIAGDAGTATPSSHSFTIVGGEGIDTSAAGNNITITGENATTSNKGVASFNSNDFSVSTGAVSLQSTLSKNISGTNTNIITPYQNGSNWLGQVPNLVIPGSIIIGSISRSFPTGTTTDNWSHGGGTTPTMALLTARGNSSSSATSLRTAVYSLSSSNVTIAVRNDDSAVNGIIDIVAIWS